ncbi:MAG TPA: chaperone modulator CbpM [Niastella sp.]|nr:chaperone modulator CbpM [Niastella sp.]
MSNEHLIAVTEFCTAHQIEITFIESLAQYGLITIETVDEQLSIQDVQLPSLEKMVRLHYDLDINLEGIETIFHLLRRIETLQHEMHELKKKAGLYE